MTLAVGKRVRDQKMVCGHPGGIQVFISQQSLFHLHHLQTRFHTVKIECVKILMITIVSCSINIEEGID